MPSKESPTSSTSPLELFAASSLFSDQEVAEATGTSRGSWQNLRALGRGPKYVKFGRSVRYRGCDLNAYFRLVNPVEDGGRAVA